MVELPGSGWIVEHGIGEKRALLIENGRVVAAKMACTGEPQAGAAVQAKLVSRAKGSARGVARADNGLEILVDKLPKDASEGRDYLILLTRAPIAERGRLKRAQGRIVDRDNTSDPAQLSEDVFTLGDAVRRFPNGLWEEVWDAAWDSSIAFAGGSLLISPTPAMTLIDIDGEGRPQELALAAIPAIAQALQQFDLGGSIGIDFPTIPDKAGRKAVDDALAEALADWPHERTAMNGFGFVQIVARLEGPSLLHRMAYSRVAAAARMALRRAEMVEGGGTILLTVHPALKARIKPDWLAQLSARTGREVRIETEPGLALNGAFAQAVKR